MNKPTQTTIIGLGQTGLSCVSYLAETTNHDITVMDTRQHPPYLETMQQQWPEVEVRTGIDKVTLINSDEVIISPGMDARHPAIEAAKARGACIMGDITLFAAKAQAPIIAITGSNGKSTVTMMLAAIARQAGKTVLVGGNIGTPALSLLAEPVPDYYILELSSFQLETVQQLNAYAAVVLNISPDHMDRYDDVMAYQQAKRRIFNGVKHAIINRDDDIVSQWQITAEGSVQSYTDGKPHSAQWGIIEDKGQRYLALGDDVIMAAKQLALTERHNQMNALAAMAMASVMSLPLDAMITALMRFQGLPHRCQLVVKHNNIGWFNDSKATNVGACIAALSGITTQKNVILLAGGVAKQQDFSPLQAICEQKVKAIIVFGLDGQQLATVMPNCVRQYQAQSMKTAVKQAHGIAQAGDIVLMSPACASFDMFQDYQARGDAFINAVEQVVLPHDG